MAAANRSVFQLLRPECVRVTQAISRSGTTSTDWRQLEESLRRLGDILRGVDQLDDTLFDYVLFPILQSFRLDTEARPSSTTTAALDCLSHVLSASRSKLSHPEFSSQILLLLINLLDKQVKLVDANQASEPEIVSLCSCLQRLGLQGRFYYPEKQSPAYHPHVVLSGTLLAILLKTVTSESIAAARLPALRVAEILVKSESDASLLRRFLPGLLSSLVKPFGLIPNPRWSHKALVLSLTIIKDVISRALPLSLDRKATNLSTDSASQLDWLRSNGKNLESAFKQLAKAKEHPKGDVRAALFDLYSATLTAYHLQLDAGFVRLLVDQILHLPAEQSTTTRRLEICQLASASEHLRQVFLSVARSTIDLLPSELQTADSQRRDGAFAAAAASLAITLDLGILGPDLANATAESLLSSVVVLMKSAVPVKASIETHVDLFATPNSEHVHVDADMIFGDDIQTRSDTQALRNLIFAATRSPLGSDLLDALSTSLGTALGSTVQDLSRFWISTVCVDQTASVRTRDNPNNALQIRLHDLLELSYSASLDILQLPPLDEQCDWRSQILAMKLVTQRALEGTVAFRPELVYALYPIVERIACSNNILQRHALEALRIISLACGYETPGHLLMHNADYLINAVSIRLNTFDVRPESASVLQVAIKLCGAPFLPFVGDLTESMFTVLNLYHGYPLLVQSMFNVLASIIDQAPITDLSKHPAPDAPPSFSESELMHRITELGVLNSGEILPTLESTLDPYSGSNSNADDSETVTLKRTSVEPLVARVLRQTQFYLTYDSPGVRLGLLQILDTGFCALKHDQDVLLPVVNDLWPVLVLKVYDSEAYVARQALKVLTTLVMCAGDFLSSRLEDEWPRLKWFFAQHKPVADITTALKTNMASVRTITQASTIWGAIVDFVNMLTGKISLSPEMEDDVFKVFGQTHCLTKALSDLNADALWLCQQLSSKT